MESPYALFDIHAQQCIVRDSDPTTKKHLPLLSILGTEQASLPLLNALVEYGCVPRGQEETARELASLEIPPLGGGIERWSSDEEARKLQRDAMLYMRHMLMLTRITRREWPAPLCELYNSLAAHYKLAAARYWNFACHPSAQVPEDAKQYVFVFCCRALQITSRQTLMHAPSANDGLILTPVNNYKPTDIRIYSELLDKIRAYVMHVRTTHAAEITTSSIDSLTLDEVAQKAFFWGVPRLPECGKKLIRFIRELLALYLLQIEPVAPKRIRLIPYE